MKMYGIPNCDTIKKARKLLEQHQLDYEFHDYKQLGIDTPTIQSWLETVDLATLVNKRSTTWRQLTDDQKSDLLDNANLQILSEHPTLIKRPVLVKDKSILVGFKAADYESLL